MQKEYHAKGKKLCMFLVDLEKSFDRVPRKVLEWGMRKKGMSDVLVRSVMNLYEGAQMGVSVDSELSEEFEVKVGMHQGFVLSPFLFSVWVDVVTEFARLGEFLYADDLVLMSETTKRLRNYFLEWKETFLSKGL